MARVATVWSPPFAAAARSFGGLLSAVLLVLAATWLRVWLGQSLPALTVFSFYYPAILGAALIGGEASAALALGLGLLCSWLVLRPVRYVLFPGDAIVVNLGLFALSGVFIGAAGARLRRLLRQRSADLARLAEREARYRVLFEGVTEGFAMLEGVRDPDGRLVDLRIVEANPATLKMFDIGGPIVGLLQSQLDHPPPAEAYLPACEQALRGERVRFEAFGRHDGRWIEVRMNRAGENLIAQIAVDITERKAAETHRSEMFDELNHRVKNNLAAVSAMLNMQARHTEDGRVREQLQRAVDRIETIGDVHASLYRTSSVDQVDFGDYLQRLCDRLSATVVDTERVRLEAAVETVMTSVDEAVALGLIVNELVTNAAKHAYPPPAAGAIQVSLRKRPEELELRVSDEGRGLPEGLESRGIGMRLVRSLVQQCHGKLEIAGDHGASFTVRLRDRETTADEAARSRLP